MPLNASTEPYRFVSPDASIAVMSAPTRTTLYRIWLLVIGGQEAKLFAWPTTVRRPNGHHPIRLCREYVSERVVRGVVQRVRAAGLAGRERGRPSRDCNQSRRHRVASRNRNPFRFEDSADRDPGDDRPRVACCHVRMPGSLSDRREGQGGGLAHTRRDWKVDGPVACDSR